LEMSSTWLNAPAGCCFGMATIRTSGMVMYQIGKTE
jgi:hypothetical protein